MTSTLSEEFLKDFDQEIEEETGNFEQNLTTCLQNVEKFSQNPKDEMSEEEYSCISQSNSLIFQIDEEIFKTQKLLHTVYGKKFPELETQVFNPIQYAKVVIKMKNVKDLSTLDMTDILPSAICIILKITHSTTKGGLLSEEDLKKSLDLADTILSLDEKKKHILGYISSRMTLIAPNLSLIVGTTVAAQLIGSVGGLSELAKIPGNVIQILGKEKKNLKGLSTKTVIEHAGFIGDCPFVQQAPPEFRKKVVRVVAMKAALAARLDSFGQDKNGEGGRKIKEEIEEHIEKLQELPPAKQEKPLPIPDEKKKTKRGGRKARKLKEKYRQTELMAKMNKIAFGVAEKEIGESGKGLGMLGIDAGKMRVKAQTKIKAKKIVEKKIGFQTNGLKTTVSGIQTSGFSTIVPGVEILPPKEKKEEKYFSNLEFKNLKK